jgi:hypothetical protein
MVSCPVSAQSRLRAAERQTVRLLRNVIGRPFLAGLSNANLIARCVSARRASARCAAVVRMPVVRTAGCRWCGSSARGAGCSSCAGLIVCGLWFRSAPVMQRVIVCGCSSNEWVVVPCDTMPVWSAYAVGYLSSDASRRTRRCSGRALRHEIGAILERDFVPSVVPLSTARR